jgi:hypothetical protein
LAGEVASECFAMGVVERIKEIEDEMARTQKNKATEGVSLDVTFRTRRCTCRFLNLLCRNLLIVFSRSWLCCLCVRPAQHLGLLKAKLAKLRRELIEGPKVGGNVSSSFCRLLDRASQR